MNLKEKVMELVGIEMSLLEIDKRMECMGFLSNDCDFDEIIVEGKGANYYLNNAENCEGVHIDLEVTVSNGIDESVGTCYVKITNIEEF